LIPLQGVAWHLADDKGPVFPLRHIDGQIKSIRFRRLFESDLPAVHTLHELAHSLISQSGLLAKETDTFFLSHIQDVGQLYGSFLEDELIAYTVLGLPKVSDYNFGRQFGLTEGELEKVAHCDGSIVHPDWRVNHLQQRFIDWRLLIASSYGREHAISTAAPRNPASWRNLIRSGFAIYKLLDMFGADRFLLYRCLGSAHKIDAGRFEIVDVSDRPRMQALLAEGWIAVDYHDTQEARCELVLAKLVV